MKIKILAIVLLVTNFVNAQKIKVDKGEVKTSTDNRPVISKVINNKIYVATFENDIATITGFDVNTMKQVSSFKTEKLKRIIDNGVLFIDAKIIVLHMNKWNNSTILGDVFSYDGKNLIKDISLTDFKYVNSNDYGNEGKFMASENGKYFMITNSNYEEKASFDYSIYSDNIKLIKKGSVKFPEKNSEAYVQNLILSNTANIGALIYQDNNDEPLTTFFILKKESKQIEEVKILSDKYVSFNTKYIGTKNAYFITGLFGLSYEHKNEHYKKMLHGAFGIKLDLNDLSISYSNFTDFNEEQVKTYNQELNKVPIWKMTTSNWEYVKTNIFNEFLRINIDAVSIDKDENIVMGISSFHWVDEHTNFTSNIIVGQFRLNKSGNISNFVAIPKYLTMVGQLPEEYLFSLIFCSNENILSIYNDDESNIKNLTDITKNKSKLDKSALLTCAETDQYGSFKKYALLPYDKDVLVFAHSSLYIDCNLTFATATRDKGEVVLLKFTSIE